MKRLAPVPLLPSHRLVLLLVLAGLAPAVATGEDYSRHCKPPEEDKTSIRSGSYTGEFTQEVQASRPLPSGVVRQTYTAKGKFRIEIDRERGTSRAGCMVGLPSKVTGDFETTLDAHMPMRAGEGTVQRMGGGALRLEKACVSQFVAAADVKVSGQLCAAGRCQQQAGGGQARLVFKAREAGCFAASGELYVDAMDQTAETLRNGGHTVMAAAGSWHMTRVPDDLERARKELKEELNRAPSGDGAKGLVRTYEREGRRIGEIADRFRKRDPTLWECLAPTWLEHAERWAANWVGDETAKLKASTGRGDFTALSGQIRSALSADRALALVGRDSCSAPLHAALFAAMEQALGNYLARMAEGHASMEHLLEVLRQAELLGEVAPGLREKVSASIQADAKRRADAAWQAFTAALKAARGRGASVQTDSAVQKALQSALTAERAAQNVGVDLDRATTAAVEMGWSPRIPGRGP